MLFGYKKITFSIQRVRSFWLAAALRWYSASPPLFCFYPVTTFCFSKPLFYTCSSPLSSVSPQSFITKKKHGIGSGINGKTGTGSSLNRKNSIKPSTAYLAAEGFDIDVFSVFYPKRIISSIGRLARSRCSPSSWIISPLSPVKAL